MTKETMSGFERARRADGMKVVQACAVMGITTPTWYQFLEAPWRFELGKVSALYQAFSPEARALCDSEIDSLFGRTA